MVDSKEHQVNLGGNTGVTKGHTNNYKTEIISWEVCAAPSSLFSPSKIFECIRVKTFYYGCTYRRCCFGEITCQVVNCCQEIELLVTKFGYFFAELQMDLV